MEGAGPVMVLEGALKFRNRFAFTTHTQPHLTVLTESKLFRSFDSEFKVYIVGCISSM